MKSCTALSAQSDFNNNYITAYEILKTVGVTRAALTLAKRRGVLPPPIVLPGSTTQLWVRKEVAKAVYDWQISATEHKGRIGA